jgi:hypothetical protein
VEDFTVLKRAAVAVAICGVTGFFSDVCSWAQNNRPSPFDGIYRGRAVIHPEAEAAHQLALTGDRQFTCIPYEDRMFTVTNGHLHYEYQGGNVTTHIFDGQVDANGHITIQKGWLSFNGQFYPDGSFVGDAKGPTCSSHQVLQKVP